MQRCSSEARVRDCPPHRPEEQWLCCFARLQRDIPKVPTLNRKKEQSTIYMLNSCPGGTRFFFTGGKAGEKHRACGLSSRPPRDAPKPIAIVFLLSCCLELLQNGFLSGIVGRMKRQWIQQVCRGCGSGVVGLDAQHETAFSGSGTIPQYSISLASSLYKTQLAEARETSRKGLLWHRLSLVR